MMHYTVWGIGIIYIWGYRYVKRAKRKSTIHGRSFLEIVLLFWCQLTHICKSFDRFCKIFDCLIRITVFNSITYTVFDMTFQDNLTAFM